MRDLIFDPLLPVPLIAVSGGVLLWLTICVYLSVGKTLEQGRNLLLLLFRTSGIVLLLMLLLQPSRQEMLPPPAQERVTLLGIDTSLSMKQRDVQQTTRLDAAKGLLLEANAISRNGQSESPRLRFFEFSEDAIPIANSILDLTPKGKTTRLHQSILTMLNTTTAGVSANAIILLTDGHDFELVNPAKTAAAARSRQVPIYAIPLGKQGKVRDVSVRITSFQPYCYVKQKARITAALRLIGCEFEDLTVQLLRHGKASQSKRVNAGELQELSLEFEVMEPEVGQFEYEVRVQPLEKEVDTANNSAITYLNVIDQQIRVLVLEGDPYWDTTFLQRSLMRNDKFDVDSLVRFSNDRVRPIRKSETLGPLKMPDNLDEFGHYDVIVLGRQVDSLLNARQTTLLEQYVKERNGTIIFGRGPAFEKPGSASELEPVLWGEKAKEHVRLDPTTEGRSLSAFRTLRDGSGDLAILPELLAGRNATETKPLTAILATAANPQEGAAAPAIVHRRYGRGQVVSVGVDGLWRWGLNAKADGVNTPFDRFWDQMILWLLAGRDFIPNRQFSFRPNSANIILGEKVFFRLTMRQPQPNVKSVPMTVYLGDEEIARINLSAQSADADRLSGEFLPPKVGRYRAVAKFPDGTSQESRFIVFTDNLEETEVATDVVGLRRLCDSCGGRVIQPSDLSRLLNELGNESVDVKSQTRLRPVWNEPWVFYLVGVLFGLDWFLRRRWGLC